LQKDFDPWFCRLLVKTPATLNNYAVIDMFTIREVQPMSHMCKAYEKADKTS